VSEIEEPLRERLCERLEAIVEGLKALSERHGRLMPDPATFANIMYYARQLQERYACPIREET